MSSGIFFSAIRQPQTLRSRCTHFYFICPCRYAALPSSTLNPHFIYKMRVHMQVMSHFRAGIKLDIHFQAMKPTLSATQLYANCELAATWCWNLITVSRNFYHTKGFCKNYCVPTVSPLAWVAKWNETDFLQQLSNNHYKRIFDEKNLFRFWSEVAG